MRTCLKKTLQELNAQDNEEALLKLSMDMIIQANILSIYAKKILHTLNEEDKNQNKKIINMNR